MERKRICAILTGSSILSSRMKLPGKGLLLTESRLPPLGAIHYPHLKAMTIKWVISLLVAQASVPARRSWPFSVALNRAS
jgi:hypothetical protein